MNVILINRKLLSLEVVYFEAIWSRFHDRRGFESLVDRGECKPLFRVVISTFA